MINDAVTAGIMALLVRGINKKVTAGLQGEYFMRLPKAYFYTGILCLLIALVMVTGYFIPGGDTVMLIVLTLTLAFFGWGGILMLLYYKNHYLRFDNSFIEVRDYRGRIKYMTWKDIEEVKFNSVSGLLILQGKSGDKLKVSQYLVGLKIFLDHLVTHTEIPTEKIKRPAY